jgi:hypothetical protein
MTLRMDILEIHIPDDDELDFDSGIDWDIES